MLHFRPFLMSALMVGAALFLPDNAFAEKNEIGGQPNSHKESVQANNPSEKTENSAAIQANVSTKAENAKPIAKTVAVPEQASKNQSGEKAQAFHSAPKQAASQKPVATPKSLPDQANGNGYGLSAVKKAEETVNVTGQEESTAEQATKSELDKDKLTTADAAEQFSEMATVKNKTESTRVVKRFEPQGQGSDVSKPKKVEHVEPLVPVPAEKGKVPSSKEEIPNVDQAINPTPRSNSSGGQSNDRVSQSLTTISFLEKWFEWNKYYEIKLVQPYLSRYALRNHQWVNAPPSPPPQEAPLLKTVTRS